MGIDNFFAPINIASSGIQAHRKNMEVISANIANVQTTDAGNGQPYRRLQVMMETQGRENEDLQGVSVKEVEKDMSDFKRILASPGDPRADAEGYINMPNVDIPTEMINLNYASRAYEANVAVLKRYQTMVRTSLELLK